VSRLEAVAAAAGALMVSAALAAFDWRLGLAAAGASLVASSVDLRRSRP